MGRSAVRRLLRPAKRTLARLHPPLGAAMTEACLRWVSQHAVGMDALTPALAEHVARRTGRECEVILPVTPPALRGGASPAAGTPLDRFGTAPVALWTGALHPGLERDLRLSLQAIAQVQSRGHSIAFAHVGSVLPRYRPEEWARQAGVREGTAAFLGYVPYPQIPALLDRASILLSAGHPNEYNRLRLPSKLQAYLASGTPTITYGVGFGELLEDRSEALLQRTGDPEELADLIVELLDDRTLREALSRGGPAAAARLFDPARNTQTLIRYYRRAIAGAGEPAVPAFAA
jgi:glycosyltransferase involved in cell wall biosynthesis